MASVTVVSLSTIRDLHQQNNEYFQHRQLAGAVTDVVSHTNYWSISDETSVTKYQNLHSYPQVYFKQQFPYPEFTRENLGHMKVL